MATWKIGSPEYVAEGYDVYDDDRVDYDQSARVFTGTKAEAERVLDLLNNDAFGDLSDWSISEIAEEIDWQLSKVPCERCFIDTERIEMGDNLMCRECAS